MLTSLIRTCVLFLFLIFILRFMGKRQIGQLQPSELVITILLSQIAAAPMQDNEIPLVRTMAVMAVLASLEVLSSLAGMKNRRWRRALDGAPVTVVRAGRVQQKAMRSLRFTLDDMLEALRSKNVFDLSAVEQAVVETDGTLSVLLRREERPVSAGDLDLPTEDAGAPVVLIADGEVLPEGLAECGLTEALFEKLLKEEDVRPEEVFLLTRNKNGGLFLIRKEAVS